MRSVNPATALEGWRIEVVMPAPEDNCASTIDFVEKVAAVAFARELLEAAGQRARGDVKLWRVLKTTGGGRVQLNFIAKERWDE